MVHRRSTSCFTVCYALLTLNTAAHHPQASDATMSIAKFMCAFWFCLSLCNTFVVLCQLVSRRSQTARREMAHCTSVVRFDIYHCVLSPHTRARTHCCSIQGCARSAMVLQPTLVLLVHFLLRLIDYHARTHRYDSVVADEIRMPSEGLFCDTVRRQRRFVMCSKLSKSYAFFFPVLSKIRRGWLEYYDATSTSVVIFSRYHFFVRYLSITAR